MCDANRSLPGKERGSFRGWSPPQEARPPRLHIRRAYRSINNLLLNLYLALLTK